MNYYALLLGIIFSCSNFYAMKQEEQKAKKPLVLNPQGIISEEEAAAILFDESELLPEDVKDIIANFAYPRLKQVYEESDEGLLDRLDRLMIADNTIEYCRPKDNKILKFSLIKDGIKREASDGLDEFTMPFKWRSYFKYFNGILTYYNRWKLIGISPSGSKFLLMQLFNIKEDEYKGFWVYDRRKGTFEKIKELDTNSTEMDSRTQFLGAIADELPDDACRDVVHDDLYTFVGPKNLQTCSFFADNESDFCLPSLLRKNITIQTISFSPSGQKLGIKIIDKEMRYGLIYDLESNQVNQYIFNNGKWEKQEEGK